MSGILSAYTGAVPGLVNVPPTGDTTGARDLAAINAALAGGLQVRLSGAYTINGAITPVSGSSLIGSGIVPTSITQLSTSARGISIVSGSAISDVTLQGFILIGPGSGTGVGVFASANSGAAVITRLTMKQVEVYNFGSHGCQVANSVLSVYEQCQFYQNGGNGFFQNQNTTTAMTDCWANHNTLRGFYLQAVTAAVITGGGADVNALGYELNACKDVNLISCDANGTVAGGGLDGSSFKISGASEACIIQSCYVSGNAAIAYFVTGNSIKNTLTSVIELATGGATASIQVDSGSAAAIINPDVNTAQSLPGSTITLQPGYVFVSTLESSSVIIDDQTLALNAGGSNISQGTGAPSKPNSVNPIAGDIWFRTDTPSTVNQRLYVCTTGGASPVWSGIA